MTYATNVTEVDEVGDYGWEDDSLAEAAATDDDEKIALT